jgi:hypothetical protein
MNIIFGHEQARQEISHKIHSAWNWTLFQVPVTDQYTQTAYAVWLKAHSHWRSCRRLDRNKREYTRDLIDKLSPSQQLGGLSTVYCSTTTSGASGAENWTHIIKV